jgi:hypothetical protein
MSDESPSKELDRAIKEALKRSQSEPFDMQIKALNTAVSWYKVKHAIMSKDDDFDPDDI